MVSTARVTGHGVLLQAWLYGAHGTVGGRESQT